MRRAPLVLLLLVFVGPALAGFLIPWIGLEGAYAVDVGFYLLAVRPAAREYRLIVDENSPLNAGEF